MGIFESQKYNILIISILAIVSLLFRINFASFDIPILLDGLEYYSFGYEVAFSHNYPVGILGTNDGWSLFLSSFFMLFNNTDFMTLNFVQRSLSISLSVITVIPVYYLCRQFVSERFAVIGAVFFIFDPRIISNSTLGIIEPLFIFLNVLVLVTIFKNNSKFIYLSFLLIALSSIVRYEGLLMIIPVAIFYFLRFRFNQKIIRNFFIGLIIFLIILSPIVVLRTSANGMDGLSSHIFPSAYISQELDKKLDDESIGGRMYDNFILDFSVKSVFNTLKYLGWVSIPLFILFLPFAAYRIFQNKNDKINYLLLFSAFLIIPALYAYGREIQETRYLLVLVPIFSVFSAYGLSKFRKLSSNFWIAVLFIGIISMSILFLWYFQDEEYNIKKETYYVSKIVTDVATGVNNYEKSHMLKAAELDQNWPEPLEVANSGKFEGEIVTKVNIIPVDDSSDLVEFIHNSKTLNLSHLVIFEKNQKEFFDDVFMNPENYPYLELEFDSDTIDFENKILIYEINYERFNDFIVEK